MFSNKYTGPGALKLEILTEANVSINGSDKISRYQLLNLKVYILGEEEVPTLVTPKTDFLIVGPYVSYT